MHITNKTNRPISVPLPGGKRLFLGPRKTGQVNAKAVEHPPLVKLVEAGDLEIGETGRQYNIPSTGAPSARTESQASAPAGNIRRTGDR